MPGIISGTISSYLPWHLQELIILIQGCSDGCKNALSMQTWVVDYDYIKTMGMQIVKGRNFSKDFGTDSSGIILNEAAVKVLGYVDPIGKKIYSSFQDGSNNPLSLKTYTIVGVVKDFHYESLRQNIYPLSLRLGHNSGNVSFKVSTKNLQELVKLWRLNGKLLRRACLSVIVLWMRLLIIFTVQKDELEK